MRSRGLWTRTNAALLGKTARFVSLLSVLLAVLSGVALAAPAAQAQPGWNPQVAIVFPQDGQGHQTGVAQSHAVNVSVWPTNEVSCKAPADVPPDQRIILSMATNNEPALPIAVTPQWLQRMVNGVAFPSEEFDNVPADVATNPEAKFSFVVVGGVLAGGPGEYGNVWVHAADSRTYYPQPIVPTSFSSTPLPNVDLRIQIVWPHDAQGNYTSVDQATFVNIAVDLFEHGTRASVRPDFPPPTVGTPTLNVAESNGPLKGSGIVAQKITYAANGQTYPRWVFNNVPVVPGKSYHFMAEIGGQFAYHAEYSSIWTHAADARTILPNPQAPPACA